MIADNNSNDWPVQLAFDPKKVDKPRDQSKKSLQQFAGHCIKTCNDNNKQKALLVCGI
jgi:hypothetical protein